MTSHSTDKSTWILVANRALATIFASRGQQYPMTLVERIENPRGKLQSSQMEEDRPGRAFDRAGHGRHALSSEESAREHVERSFAAQLAARLDHKRCEGLFDQLILIAGPKFLGLLREQLSEPTRRLVKVDLNKELLETTEQSLREHLAGLAPI